MVKLLISGIAVLSLVQVVHGVDYLTCINCNWDALSSKNSTESCIGQPHEEGNSTCQEQYICQTKLHYVVVGDRFYLKKIVRGCHFRHRMCNQHCNPTVNKECYLCCDETDLCNSLPLNSDLLPANTTGSSCSYSVSSDVFVSVVVGTILAVVRAIFM